MPAPPERKRLKKVSNVIIDLKYPTDKGLSQITLRRPKVRDMIASDKSKGSDADKEVALFANLAELSPDEIASLDMADYKQLQDAYKDFLS
jgi:hypothetical protein